MEIVETGAEYILYGPPLSLFTRKLEAALRFYGVPFRSEAKTQENSKLLETRSGSHQVPVFQTPENWLLADTTPILSLLAVTIIKTANNSSATNASGIIRETKGSRKRLDRLMLK